MRLRRLRSGVPTPGADDGRMCESGIAKRAALSLNAAEVIAACAAATSSWFW